VVRIRGFTRVFDVLMGFVPLDQDDLQVGAGEEAGRKSGPN